MAQMSTKLKAARRGRRKFHIRHRVQGRADRPRLTVFRSASHIYAQMVDDATGRTLCSASTQERDARELLAGKTGNCKAAEHVGKRLAEKAKDAGITKVVFDRNGFRYHGRVKTLADAARAAGLEF